MADGVNTGASEVAKSHWVRPDGRTSAILLDGIRKAKQFETGIRTAPISIRASYCTETAAGDKRANRPWSSISAVKTLAFRTNVRI